MILTDYYHFERLSGGKSKTRMDCTASTQSYNPLESLRNKQGRLFVYVGDNTHTNDGKRGKSDLALTNGIHITSLYTTAVETGRYYGDFNNTPDALLMVCTGFEKYTNGSVATDSVIDLYVARGYEANIHNLFDLFIDGELQSEIARLQQQAKPEPPGSLRQCVTD